MPRGLLSSWHWRWRRRHRCKAAEVGSTELIRQCKYPRQGKRTIGKNADALQCLRYVEGFVAGASIVAGPRRPARLDPQVRNITHRKSGEPRFTMSNAPMPAGPFNM